jgi:hypothetical protein
VLLGIACGANVRPVPRVAQRRVHAGHAGLAPLDGGGGGHALEQERRGEADAARLEIASLQRAPARGNGAPAIRSDPIQTDRPRPAAWSGGGGGPAGGMGE